MKGSMGNSYQTFRILLAMSIRGNSYWRIHHPLRHSNNWMISKLNNLIDSKIRIRIIFTIPSWWGLVNRLIGICRNWSRHIWIGDCCGLILRSLVRFLRICIKIYSQLWMWRKLRRRWRVMRWVYWSWSRVSRIWVRRARIRCWINMPPE